MKAAHSADRRLAELGIMPPGPFPPHENPLGPEVHPANFQARDVTDDNEIAHLTRDLATVVEVRV